MSEAVHNSALDIASKARNVTLETRYKFFRLVKKQQRQNVLLPFIFQYFISSSFIFCVEKNFNITRST